MAINLPGKEKILNLLHKLFPSFGASENGDSRQVADSWFTRLQKSHLLKLIVVSALFLICSLFLLLSVSFKIVHSVEKYADVSFVTPSLGDYLPSMASETKNVISDTEGVVEDNQKAIEKFESKLPQIDTDIAIYKSFEFLSKFENNKSKKALLMIKPVVTGIQKNSMAEIAGLQIGDVLLKVNGDPIESVLGFYILTSEKPSNEVTFEIDRKGKITIVKLTSNGSLSINSKNIGLVFDIPNGNVFVTQDEVKKLAQQYKDDFLATISSEWQSQFANNLLRMTQQISLESQVLANTNSPEKYPISKLKTNEFLQWHHQKYVSNMNEFYGKKSQVEGQIIHEIGSLGDALTGLSASLLAFLCAILYYLFIRKS